MQEKLRSLYKKNPNNKLPSFLEEEQGHQSIESSYINLAIIDLKTQHDRETRLSSSSSSKTQEIDTELDSPEDNIDDSNTIDIEKLFNNSSRDKGKEKVGISNENNRIEEKKEEIDEQEEQLSKIYQKVLIHGKAGIGKTTLMKYITYQWAHGKLWNQFDYVFFLPLRELNNFQKRSHYDGIESFIYECCLSGGTGNFDIEIDLKEIREILDKSKVLLLLDGYDEFAPKEENKAFMRSIVNAVLDDPLTSVIMTSRPNMVENRYKELFDCQLVNIGFSDSNINDYIEKNFKGAEQEKQSLYKLIRENKTIQGMCHTPINLHLLCLVWVNLLNEKQGKINSQEFSTTSLYVGITSYLIKRYAKKVQCKNLQYVNNLTYEQIERDYQSILIIHERIAFEGLKQGKAVLEGSALKRQGVDAESYEQIQKIGLLKAIDGGEQEDNRESNNSSKRKEESAIEIRGNIDKEHYFIHLTFQEYMAARCLVRMLNSGDKHQVKEAVEFLNNNKYVQRLERTICFVAGIVSIDKNQSSQPSQALLHFWNMMINGKMDLSVLKQLNLIIKCIDESSIDERIPDIENIKDYLKDTIQSITKTRGIRTLGKMPERIEKWLGIAKISKEIDKEQEIRNLLAKLQSKDEKEKIEAIEALKETEIEELSQKDQKQIIEILLKLFENSQDELYRKAQEGLKELALRVKDEGLLTLISDEMMKEEIRESELRIEIKEAARSKKSTLNTTDSQVQAQIVTALVLLLENKDGNVRISAAQLLSKGKLNITDPQVQAQMVPALLLLLENKDWNVRTSAVERLGKLNITDPQVQAQMIKALVPLLESKDEDVRNSVARLLGKLNITDPQMQGQMITALLLLLESKNWNVRTNAAELLDKLNIVDLQAQAQMITALLPLLKSENKWIRNNATQLLDKLNIVDLQAQAQMITALLPLLKSENEWIHNNVTQLLGKLNITNPQVQAQIVTALLPLFESKDKSVRLRAAELLGKLNIIDPQVQGQIVTALLPLFESKDKSVRLRAAELLGKLNIIDPQVQAQIVTVLIPLLENKDKSVRLRVAELLSKITDPQVQAQMVTALLPLLKSKDWRVCIKVARLLGKIINPQVQTQIITALMPLLESEDKGVRISAAELLGKLNITDPQVQTQIVTALIPLLENKDKSVRLRVAELLSKITDPQVQAQIVTALMPLLENKDKSVRLRVAELLSKITDPQVQTQMVTALLPWLEIKDWDVRNSAAELLGKLNITDPQVQTQMVTTLLSLLEKDWDIRISAAELLGKLNITDPQVQTQIVTALIPLLKSKDKWICLRVAELLSKITDPQVQTQMVTALLPWLEIKDWDVRNSAAELLGKLNITDPQVQRQMVTALLSLLKSKNNDASNGAAELLVKLNITNPQLQGQMVTALLSLLESKNNDASNRAAELLGKLNITDPQVHRQMVTALVPLLESEDKWIRLRAAELLVKLNITDPQLQGQMVTALVPLLESKDWDVSNRAAKFLGKLNITDLEVQKTLITRALLLFENIDIATLTNVIKVLSSLKMDCNQIDLQPLAEKLSSILIDLIKDQSKGLDSNIEVIKLRIAYILSKVQFKDFVMLESIVMKLTRQQDKAQTTTLLNIYTEQLLLNNMSITLTLDTLKLLSLPLFKQAAVVVDEDKVIINYRGYQREISFAENEDKADMAYRVFNYFYQQHQLNGVATELLDQRLNFNKAIQISDFDIELGNITLAKSVLQQHSYSCVNNTIRLNCQQWIISVVRRDRSVCNNARHVFMIIEGRNIFHEAELYRLELLQPNAEQFPERGRIEIMEEAHIDVGKQGELARVFQIILGNTKYNGNNGFRLDQDYYHKSCTVSREVAMQIITQAREEKAKAAEVTYDFYGIKAPNCFSWARKKLRENLEAKQYERLEIEKAGERYADPLAYLGPTANSTWAWMSHNVNDVSCAIGAGKLFRG